MGHKVTYRVYFEDTDAGGVVYHANYLNFCERGRTELLRACGYTNQSIIQKEGVIFVVAHITADYIKPLFLEDEIEVETTLARAKNTSMIMNQIIRRDDGIVFNAEVTLVCVNKETVKPTRIPGDVREAFEKYGS
jgi:acyl-CoA thioester hydrolase